ncbi:MAG: choice-of-anchor B family protein, partial [Planctomycetes bacterium]|nr:choice-of-anchor B family protein [Planctomycetota bacterium]
MNARSCRSAAIGLTAVLLLGSAGAATASAQFESFNVSLYAQIDLNTFGAGSGNDCWGYVSPSGREYALMGVSNKVAFVEITDPGNPDWFASVGHSNNLWGDIKVYQDVAYAVTETNTGIQVIDMSDIDNHNVSLVRTIGSPSQNHNIAINADSGYLYTAISRGGSATTVIFDLSDPLNPVEVGTWSGGREHDLQVVTYTSGPFAGREIMFGSGEGRGFDVIDVTDKSNTFLLSRTTYPNLSYAHQSWTEDLRYVYLNDELDGSPRTLVFDIADLNNPVNVAEFTNGTQAIDHNNYVHDGIMYAANYHAGMRIFDLNASPTDPPQIGWFDTFPPDNGDGFDGAWSVYPFFPSGTVIVSDMNRGLFILDVSAAFSGSLIFTLPNGLPEFIDPAGGTTVRVEVTGDRGVEPEPGTGKFFFDTGAGFVQGQMNDVTPNVYDAVFPATECGTEVSFYFSADSTGGDTFTHPPDAPAGSFQTVSLLGRIVFFQDNFETNTGWTAQNLGASSGDWQRGVPVNDPRWDYAPITDSDGSGSCFLTENENNPNYPNPWNTDVDDGAVRLTSPTLDMSAPGVTISYDYYLRLTQAPQNTDHLLVEIDSNDGAGPWTEIARHSADNGRNWTTHIITQADLEAAGVTPTSTMKMRFTAHD